MEVSLRIICRFHGGIFNVVRLPVNPDYSRSPYIGSDCAVIPPEIKPSVIFVPADGNTLSDGSSRKRLNYVLSKIYGYDSSFLYEKRMALASALHSYPHALDGWSGFEDSILEALSQIS